jgi:hypothetical protein
MEDNYSAIPVKYIGQYGVVLATVDMPTAEHKNYLRCDCHDAYWHWGEVHYADTDAGELVLCDLPFTAWPDHPRP